MAARRKKASTRARAKQGGARTRKNAPSKGGRHKPVVRAKPKKATPRAASKARKPKKAVKVATPKKTAPKASPKARKPRKPTRVATPKKRAFRAAPKARKPKKQRRPRSTSVAKRAKQAFHKLRKVALKKGKLTLPLFPKRKGRTPLRGAKGPQRDLPIYQFWEDIREIWLESWVMKTYESLESEFTSPPSMYGRFTFTITKVSTLMTMGSPKLMRGTKTRVKHWFVAIPLSYSLEGARFQFQRTYDNITKEIADTRADNPKAEFFLEYLTLIAYAVRA